MLQNKISSELNEGPLLWRLLETLGMVEIPQGTLLSPPQEESGRNQSQQWQSTRVCHQRRNKKKPQYNELTKNTYDDLSLLKPGQINILKDLQSISKLSYVKTPSSNRKTVSRSLHIFAETKQSTNFKHYMNSDASTCISMHRHAQHHDPTLASTCIINHQQNRMYTSTAC